MTLDESAQSEIKDSSLWMAGALDAVMYKGSDNRPAWIGGYRPATSVEGLKRAASWAATHYDFYLNFVRDDMDKRGTILDIGCGAGQNTAMLARYGEWTVGVDSDPKAIQFAVTHNAMTGARFLSGRFPEVVAGQSFDYIFCIETVEHVPYEGQEAFLRSGLEMLRPRGKMFLTTPNEDTPSPPHIGVWSPTWRDRLKATLSGHILKHGYFSNGTPAAGMSKAGGSHHALVLG